MAEYRTLEKIKSQYHKLDGVSEDDIKVLEVIIEAGFILLEESLYNKYEQIIEPNVILTNMGESIRCDGGSNVFSKIKIGRKIVYECHCGAKHRIGE